MKIENDKLIKGPIVQLNQRFNMYFFFICSNLLNHKLILEIEDHRLNLFR